MEKLRPPNYQQKLEQCEEIIRSAKKLKGLSDFGPWKEVIKWINRKIEGLERYRDSILLGLNKDIPTDRELVEVKSTAREIKGLEEIRDIEKSFSKDVNNAAEEKERLQKLIEKQKAPKAKRKYAL